MGNLVSAKKESKALPIHTIFKLPSPLPSWPPGEGFASGIIDLGGLQVCQITSFTKICSSSKGGPNDNGATFFEPSPIPSGFSMLASYCQPNDTPLFGWVLAGKDVSGAGTLAAPVDYVLAWSSPARTCNIWLPTPPEGYKPVGYVVTSSPEKPSGDKIRCVRADLTEECENEELLWGRNEINVYSTRPKTRGKKAQGVAINAFNLETNGSILAISCLKNNNFDNLTSIMPNLAQIDALIQEYSPRFYFHPNETYFISSTNWYFENGVVLVHDGDGSSPVRVEPNGSNLPQGGSNDGTYWLDLPVEDDAQEKIKKGDLQNGEAYLHIKPMYGATFTDIAIWVFYPFNGPSRAKLGLVDVPLGRIGEHIGDWEHVTLRVSNFDGVLRRVYFAQHSRGMWVSPTSLEFLNGTNKFAAYPSLHGHATYPAPGLVLQGSGAVGIRNDTAKSDKFFDVAGKYSVVAAEYIGAVVEPPWLNYFRKWGPKITYEIGVEIGKLKSSSAGSIKSAIGSLVSVLPNEFSFEDGPTGPKMKVDWEGDER